MVRQTSASSSCGYAALFAVKLRFTGFNSEIQCGFAAARTLELRQRWQSHKTIGSRLSEPNIDDARLAQSMGIHAEGPITNPNDLAPALSRAIAVVKKGEPALVDVVTQVR